MELMNEATELASQIGAELIPRGWTVTTAESCTGGLAAGALTAIAGSSAWFHGGLVTYANHVKTNLAGVPPDVLRKYGAVSRETVEAMARGAAVGLDADMAIAISGIAGPQGGVPGKPVGTVWIAIAGPNDAVESHVCHFDGDRQSVRMQAVVTALRATLMQLKHQSVTPP